MVKCQADRRLHEYLRLRKPLRLACISLRACDTESDQLDGVPLGLSMKPKTDCLLQAQPTHRGPEDGMHSIHVLSQLDALQIQS